MRDDFEQSEFFKNHEFIGTSLLLIADKNGSLLFLVWFFTFSRLVLYFF